MNAHSFLTDGTPEGERLDEDEDTAGPRQPLDPYLHGMDEAEMEQSRRRMQDLVNAMLANVDEAELRAAFAGGQVTSGPRSVFRPEPTRMHVQMRLQQCADCRAALLVVNGVPQRPVTFGLDDGGVTITAHSVGCPEGPTSSPGGE